METIEEIDRKINRRIDILINISQNSSCDLYSDIQKLKERYLIGVLPHLLDYHKSESTPEKIKSIQSYNKFIQTINIRSLLDQYFNRLLSSEIILENIDELTYEFRKCHFTSNVQTTNYESCSLCQTKMALIAENSELKCPHCGNIERINGCIFDMASVSKSDLYKPQNSSYKPSRHFKYWMTHIQGRETTVISESVIELLRKCIMRDKVKPQNLTCKHIRKYLKSNNLTNYNDNVVRIRSILTNKQPPEIDAATYSIISVVFDNVIRVYQAMSDRCKNIKYYPFFIYKIVEKKIADPVKRKQILDCIHLQSAVTLDRCNIIWNRIYQELIKENEQMFDPIQP